MRHRNPFILIIHALLITCLVGSVHAQMPTAKAPCRTKGVVKTGKRCACPGGFLYSAITQRCVQQNEWCRRNYARKSVYNPRRNQCRCPSGYVIDTAASACVKKGQLRQGQGRIDDSNWSGGSGQFDFESGRNTTDGTADLTIGGIIFEGTWTGAVDWQVVEMNETFENLKECPATGYANVDDPDGDGFGTPRTARSGRMYCLKTGQSNFAKVEVLRADMDTEHDWRVCTFRYAIRIGGGRTFP